MLSEWAFLVSMLMILSQDSSLISSVMIIPMSMAAVLTMSSINSFSGFFLTIYVMIFIGGLIILLVSVASVSLQDQVLMPSHFHLMASMMMVLCLNFKTESFSKSLVPSSWLLTSYYIGPAVGLVLLVLMVISYNLQIFKGLIRIL